MDDLTRKFLQEPIKFSEEPVVYCNPTPRAFLRVVEARERALGTPEAEIREHLQFLRDYQVVLEVMES